MTEPSGPNRTHRADDSASTASALVDAAEALMAEVGVTGASLRAVMRTAGTDPGAIHYHFGGREALAAAVLERTLVPLNQHRMELLDLAESRRAGAPLDLTEAIDALIRPDVEQARRLQERGNGRARLIAEIYLEPSALVKPLVEQHFRPVAARFMPHMSRAAPHVDPTTLSWRVRWLVFPMLGALALDEDAMFALDEHELVDRIVTASAAALAAETGAS